MIQQATIDEVKQKIDERPWYPIDVLKVNDQVVRMAYAKGEYHWHVHDQEDEMFYLLEGEFTVRLRNFDDVVMKPGDFMVVPKGEEHAPISLKGGYILMFEPLNTISTGS